LASTGFPQSASATVAIIGGGKMGADIAALFAAGGFAVHVEEPAQAMRATFGSRAGAALRYLRAEKSARSRIRLHAALASLPWSEVTLVIETIPEVLAAKQELFKTLETLAPRRAVLATNTSSLPLAKVMARVKHKDRTVLMHFATPAYAAPLVEVVRGTHTATSTIRRVNAWLTRLGKIVVNLNRDVPGMIVNRVQHAMMREAFSLVDSGVASFEDIDLAVRYGFGFRYVAVGPVRQRDLNGLGINYRAAQTIYPTLERRREPPRALANRVRAGHVGVTVGRGFYRWDKRKLADWLKRYDAALAEVLARMRRLDRELAR
jgi:3-hydroxybutyryl-CoA dehydrogenase